MFVLAKHNLIFDGLGRYDGTSMAERRLLQEQKVRKRREEIEERKRQLEEVCIICFNSINLFMC